MQLISDLTKVPYRNTGLGRLETEYKWMIEVFAEEHTLLQTLIDNLPDYIFVKDRKSRFVLNNMAHVRSLGATKPEKFIGKTDFDFFPLELAAQFYADEQTVMQTGQPLINREEVTIDRQGRQQWLLTTKVPLQDRNGEIIGLVGICRDITQRRQVEETLKLYQGQLEELVEERTTKLKATNEQLQQEIKERQQVEAALQDSLQEMENAYEQAILYAQDLRTEIAKSKHEGEIRAELEQQLRQSQKVQAIGQLAGGVAHDFNNLLTAIMGSAGLALEALPSDHPVRNDIEVIQKTAQRAAGLTRKLLTFARQQVIEPRILNLNDLILDVEELLRRLIGENIELLTWLAIGLGPVKVDPNQFEQVLVNLAVNARDAMPDGGKLIIETSNVTLDEYYTRRHTEVTSGAYVLLTVSDTGTGMTEEAQEHLFEPFFTTKEVGKGTGLGLAICFGIIKQSGGHILVYSQPEQGTTFKIYLPQVTREEASALQAGHLGQSATKD